MARLIRKEDRGPMEVKVGNASKWICMCGLSNNQPSAMAHIKRRQMKKQEKFIDIILMEPELKFNRNKIEKSDPTLIINFLVANA